MSERHAILIGSSRFPEEPTLPELEGPGRDVTSLARLLSLDGLGGFKLRQLFNRPSGEALRELDSVVSEADESATLLIYYSGQTLVDGAGRLFLATEDTVLSNLANSSVPLAFVRQLLKKGRARDIVVILDCCYGAGVAGRAPDEGAIEQRLRTLRSEVSPDLHLFARRGNVQSVAAREGDVDGEVMGALTRSIVVGLATGAADRDGDNRISARDLNLYLADQFGDERPLWVGPVDGADPMLIDNPNPIAGVGVAATDPAATRVFAPRRGRRPLLPLGLVVVIAAALGIWLAYGPGIPETAPELRRLDAGAQLPIEPVLVANLPLLRDLAARQHWVEHASGGSGRIGSRYPSVLSLLTEAEPSGSATLELKPWQSATVELGDVIFGLAFFCRSGLNLAEATVELVDGRVYRFTVETFRPEQEFFGIVSPRPIRSVRFETREGTFALEQLYFYATREHEAGGVD